MHTGNAEYCIAYYGQPKIEAVKFERITRRVT